MTFEEFKQLKLNDIIVFNEHDYSYLSYIGFYKILGFNDNYIKIKCNDNIISCSHYKSFITLNEYNIIHRKDKINKILL